MNAINYDNVMREEFARFPQGAKLLLHSCCAPCSTYCLQTLHEHIAVTVLFYNPNLDSEEEYRRRKLEQVRFLTETGWADMLDCDFGQDAFEEHVAKGRETLKEGGERCKLCYLLRLEKTAQLAKEYGYDYFATTLTVSPLKNAAWINEIGFALQEKYGVKYLPTDFKKRNGYMQSVSLSKEYSLYRQNYCGCKYSRQREIKHEVPDED